MVNLQAVSPNDAEIIYKTWGANPENFTYLTVKIFSNTNDAKQYICNILSNYENLAFHIKNENDDIVGIIKASIDGHRALIGYVVDVQYKSRGYASQAVSTITALLNKNPKIRRIWATCALENIASYRVLEKSGFKREGILKNWVIYPAQGKEAVDNYSYVWEKTP